MENLILNQQPVTEKKETNSFIVGLSYNKHSDHFFVDLSNETGCVISILITQGVAEGLSRSLNLKIMM